MEKPNEINYICRRRDAITDPPPEGKPVVVMSCNILQHVLFTRVRNRWECADDGSEWDGCEIEPGDQWLDVTDEPAIPRAKVQAAVDELFRAIAEYITATDGFRAEFHDWLSILHSRVLGDPGMDPIPKIEINRTGIAPTEDSK